MEQNSPTPLAYSVRDAARALGIGRTRAYEEIRAGRLPIVKVGKRTLVRRVDAERWLNERARETAEGVVE